LLLWAPQPRKFLTSSWYDYKKKRKKNKGGKEGEEKTTKRGRGREREIKKL